jgi:hypothetical protein
MNPRILKIGDFVVSSLFCTFKGFPYVIKISKIDDDFNIVHFNYKGEEMYMSTQGLRFATKFEKFFGPIYDFLIK